MSVWSRLIFLVVLGSPLVIYIGGIMLDSAVSLSKFADVFDAAMATRFVTSVCLGVVAAFMSTIWGSVTYLAYLSVSKRLRFVLIGLSLLPLAYPAFGVATAWMTLASWSQAVSGGRVLWGGQSLASDWLYSVPGAGWVLSLCWWPIVFFLLLLQGQPTQRQIDAALLHLTARWHWVMLYWRSWRSTLLLANVIVFGMGMVQFEVPSLLQLNAYALEIYIRFSALLDETGAVLLCLPYLVLSGVFAWVCMRWNRQWSRSSHQEPMKIRPKWIGILSGFGTTLLILLSCVFPLVMIGLHAFSRDSWLNNLLALMPVLGQSLGYSFGTATLLVLIALWFTSLRNSRVAFGGLVFGFFCFFLPGILIGSAVLQFRSYWPGMIPIWVSNGSMMWAFGLHNWVLAAGAAWLIWHRFGRRPKEAVDLLRLPVWKQIQYVYWRHFSSPGLLAVALASLFVWREVAIPVLLHPPGGETLAMQYFNRLHYGSEPQTAAVGLVMMLSPALLLFLVGFVLHFLKKETNA